MPRVVLAGSNLAATYTLDLLLEVVSPNDVLALAPTEDGRPPWHASLAAHARTRGVECLTPENVNEAAVAAKVRALDPDVFFSVYYTQVFRGELMDAIAGRALNFHPSLLPRHRGKAPLIWAIAEGDGVTGLSVHHIDQGIDTGRIVQQHTLPIHPQDTGYTLHRKMAKLVRATAAALIRDVLAGKPLPTGLEQTGPASQHSMRDPRLNHLDWSESRARIRNVVRALAPPLPGAFANAGSTTLVVARVDPIVAPPGVPRRPPGMVELSPRHTPTVWASDGPLQLTSVIVDGSEKSGSSLVEAGVLQEGSVLD